MMLMDYLLTLFIVFNDGKTVFAQIGNEFPIPILYHFFGNNFEPIPTHSNTGLEPCRKIFFRWFNATVTMIFNQGIGPLMFSQRRSTNIACRKYFDDFCSQFLCITYFCRGGTSRRISNLSTVANFEYIGIQ